MWIVVVDLDFHQPPTQPLPLFLAHLPEDFSRKRLVSNAEGRASTHVMTRSPLPSLINVCRIINTLNVT